METEQQAYERQAYEVPGSQMRWRVTQVKQQGYPHQVMPIGGGIYIMIVQHPAGADPFAYRTQPQRQPQPTAMPLHIKLAGIVVVLALAGYLAYAFAGGRDAIPATVPVNYRNLWGNIIDATGIAIGVGLFVLSALMLRALLPMVRGK